MTRMMAGALAGLMVLGYGRIACAGSDDGKTLKGTWLVQVTLRDCATGDARPPFYSLLSFDGAGTLVETTNNAAFLPGQRSPGHGTWTRTGRRTFQAFSDAFILFTSAPNPPASPGFGRGLQRIAQTITIAGDDPDQFDSSATVTFYDTAGAPVLNGCATAVGHRY